MFYQKITRTSRIQMFSIRCPLNRLSRHGSFVTRIRLEFTILLGAGQLYRRRTRFTPRAVMLNTIDSPNPVTWTLLMNISFYSQFKLIFKLYRYYLWVRMMFPRLSMQLYRDCQWENCKYTYKWYFKLIVLLNDMFRTTKVLVFKRIRFAC